LRHRLISLEFMLRYALFCDITQRIVVILHGRFGTIDFSNFVDETDRCYRSVSKKLPIYRA